MLLNLVFCCTEHHKKRKCDIQECLVCIDYDDMIDIMINTA